MRILHIVGTINPAAGGPTEVIRTLLRFAPPGYECEVATLDDPAAPFLRELEFPVHALGSAKKSWYVPAFSEWLVANRGRFDGVMVHGLWEFTGVAAWRALRGHVPYAVFTHGMLDPYFKRAFPAQTCEEVGLLAVISATHSCGCEICALHDGARREAGAGVVCQLEVETAHRGDWGGGAT